MGYRWQAHELSLYRGRVADIAGARGLVALSPALPEGSVLVWWTHNHHQHATEIFCVDRNEPDHFLCFDPDGYRHELQPLTLQRYRRFIRPSTKVDFNSDRAMRDFLLRQAG